MKRVVSLILSLCFVLSMCVFANAISFSDLTSNHWAYQNVMTLVNEGTINGYGDGTFLPSKTVTRAEFAKMIGKWNQKSNGSYSDLSSAHWGYEHIIWSGLEPVGSMMYPDVAIKRGEVINLIWKRNGSPKHNAAPSIITNQGTNSDAVSWAYTVGLMKGDDGLNLRLDGSLTRAEAAALIVRSRSLDAAKNSNNFVDVVSEDILKTTYNVLNLLGDTYQADKVLTNAELARMSIVFGADGAGINFVGNDLLDNNKNLGEFFTHKYTNEMFILSNRVWGTDYYTQANADKAANVQDAISSIMYGFVRRGTIPTDLGVQNDFYSDCVGANSTVLENMYLSYAKTHGVKLYANDKIGAQEPVTVKKYAALLVQFNDIIGLDIGYANGSRIGVKMNTLLSSNPANYTDFYRTISGVPTALYGLKKDGVSAKESYNSINQTAFVYNTYLSEVAKYIKTNANFTVDYTFYPSLSYKQDGKVSFVAKFIVKDKTEKMEISADKIFGDMIKTATGKTVRTNQEFYVVFETHELLMDIYLPRSGAYVKAVFVD